MKYICTTSAIATHIDNPEMVIICNGFREILHLSSHKCTGPLSIVKIAKVMYCSGS